MVHYLGVQTLCFFVAMVIYAISSLLETVTTGLRLFELKNIGLSVNAYKKLFKALEKNPRYVLITILIANSVSNVTAAALGTHITERLFYALNWSGELGFSVGIGIASLSMLIFGEIIPKNIAKVYGKRVFKSTLWITNLCFFLFGPLAKILVMFSNIIIYKGKVNVEEDAQDVTSEQEIQFLIDYTNSQGAMESEKSAMLKSVFNLGRTPVKEIMIPSPDVVSLSAETSLEDSLKIFWKYQFSRLPVYEGKPDNIIGMVHQKDIFFLVSKNETKSLKELIRPILLIPENLKVNQLLREFRQKKMHIAMALNEYGGVTGLVTLEDVLEEIVGEISDEYEVVPNRFVHLREGEWLVDASLELDKLSDSLGIKLQTKEAMTLGGFLTEQLHRLPRIGDEINYENYTFKVKQASTRRVSKVLITRKKGK